MRSMRLFRTWIELRERKKESFLISDIDNKILRELEQFDLIIQKNMQTFIWCVAAVNRINFSIEEREKKVQC